MPRPRLRHRLVIIPGIGGSVLADARGKIVWGRHRDLPRLAVDPETLSLDRQPQLEAVRLLETLGVCRPLIVPGYDTILTAIRNRFDNVVIDTPIEDRPVNPDANVICFPYDFRLGFAPAAERLAKVMRAYIGDQPDRQAIVVAHSLGGLVARAWLAEPGQASYCRALLTLGTPHRGAPKALAILAAGIKKLGIPLPRLTTTLRAWPGVYDLLPRYRMIASGDRMLYPHQLAANDIPDFGRLAGDAFNRHLDIERAWTDGNRAVPVLPFFARGHHTFQSASLEGTELTLSSDPFPGQSNPEWLGDGTVPANAAIPIEMSEHKHLWHPIVERHLPMVEAVEVIDRLENFSSDDDLRHMRGGDQPDRSWLGLGLPEFLTSEEPLTVTADLCGTEGEPAGKAWLSIEHCNGTLLQRLPMTPTAIGWKATAEPLPPGIYRATVQAIGPRGGDRIANGDMFAVEEP